MPIRAFKHIKAVDLAFYEQGSFRITKISKMAKRDDLKKLHDPQEGSLAVYCPDGTLVRGGEDPVVDRVFQFKAGNGGLSNVRLIDHFECWVLCVTEAKDAAVLGEGYDEVVEISDLYRLAKRLQLASKGLLGDFRIRRIKYGPRTRLYGTSRSGADPFKKADDYADEKETRVAWLTTDQTSEDMVDILCPAAIPLLRWNGRPLSTMTKGRQPEG